MIIDSSGKGRKVLKSEVIGPAVIVDTSSNNEYRGIRTRTIKGFYCMNTNTFICLIGIEWIISLLIYLD